VRDPGRVCGAKTRTDGVCQRYRLAGTTRCRLHGGASPQARGAAQRRLALQRATRAVAGQMVMPVDDPIRALRQLAGEALALKSYFRARVDALEELRYQAGAGEQTRAELLLYERALDRAAKFCEALSRLGLEERSVAVTEKQVEILTTVVERALEAAGLADHRYLRECLAAEIRTLEVRAS